MPEPSPLSRPLAQVVRDELAAQDPEGLRIVTVPTAVGPWELFSTARGSAVFFEGPGGAVAGVGDAMGRDAWSAVAEGGRGRFRHLRERLAQAALPPHLRIFSAFGFSDDGGVGPEWSDLPPNALWLPAVTVDTSGTLVVAVPPGRDPAPTIAMLEAGPGPDERVFPTSTAVSAHPPPEEYVAAVTEVVDAIRAGSLAKAVLARRLEVVSDGPIDPVGVLADLRERFPGCYRFAVRRGRRAWVGASPELLAAVDGTGIRSEPLAGSAPRGSRPEEDRAIAERLLHDPKEREEHRYVVDHVVARLRDLGVRVEEPGPPVVHPVLNVQHLATPIHGQADPVPHILDVVDALHPTPAVAGTPLDAAMTVIGKHEGFDRGWYAGGVGWITPDGRGTVALGLRAALLDGERAWLYAGAGIVGASQPDAELAETRLKFRAMLDVLSAS